MNTFKTVDSTKVAQHDLSPVNRDKVIEITHIASILNMFGIEPLTPREFDRLYEMHIVELLRMTSSYSRNYRAYKPQTINQH